MFHRNVYDTLYMLRNYYGIVQVENVSFQIPFVVLWVVTEDLKACFVLPVSVGCVSGICVGIVGWPRGPDAGEGKY